MRKDKIAIIGSGNIGLSLAKGLVKGNYCQAGQVTLTRRNAKYLAEYADQGFETSSDNVEAAKSASIVILAVLPQQLKNILAEIKPVVTDQLVISVIAGVSCADIAAGLKSGAKVVRTMPNTAISIQQSMTCIATESAGRAEMDMVKEMFGKVGSVAEIHEDLMTSATALCSCGTAFFLRAIRAASQGGVEIGFHADEALRMAVQTAKGAADLLLLNGSHPEIEIDKVTSPKGCTIVGLNEMEHQGFSSSLIKGIKLSALKASSLYNKE
jgi:pyrroline-5-carboxylate reductase